MTYQFPSVLLASLRKREKTILFEREGMRIPSMTFPRVLFALTQACGERKNAQRNVGNSYQPLQDGISPQFLIDRARAHLARTTDSSDMNLLAELFATSVLTLCIFVHEGQPISTIHPFKRSPHNFEGQGEFLTDLCLCNLIKTSS